MKRLILAGLVLASVATASADFRFSASPALAGKPVKVKAVSINDLLTKSRKDITPVMFEAVMSPDFLLATPGTEPQRYTLTVGDMRPVRFFARPTDNINISISAEGETMITGTPMLDQVAVLQQQLTEPMKAYRKAAESNDEAAAEVAEKAYNKILVDYVKAYPDQRGATWAVMQMDTEELLQYAPTLTGDATTCLLYPLLQKNIESAKARVEAEKHQQELEDSHAKAPDFSLPDLNGKMVKLSSFKGKWVVIDFWGSWCIWCIKGFPGLKDTYAKYKGKLEVIGIDCNDPEANWRAAVKKYELPWVNLYNADTKGGVMSAYGVQAFPTKVLVNPKGKIQKIYVGEDPAFYTDLENLIK